MYGFHISYIFFWDFVKIISSDELSLNTHVEFWL